MKLRGKVAGSRDQDGKTAKLRQPLLAKTEEVASDTPGKGGNSTAKGGRPRKWDDLLALDAKMRQENFRGER